MNFDQPTPFDRFMDDALNDPEHGYYARKIRGIGGRGDFTTVPMMGEALSSAIACWAARALRDSGCRHLIEVGPGEGRLALDVWRRLPWRMRWQTRLHLVERSMPLAARQRELLGTRATWHPTLPAALAACDGAAVIYSNELADAFPVRRFENTLDGWREIAVRQTSRGWEELMVEPGPLPHASALTSPWPVGQRVEVGDAYRQWLISWLPLWNRGRMLTIDYGASIETLYHRRPRGTLRAYRFHERLEGLAIYENPGHQDLTADVNFSDLIAWSRPWAETRRLENLAAFLRSELGPDAAQDSRLLEPGGAGDAFQILEQFPAAH